MASYIQNILVIFPPFNNAETPRPTHAQAGSYPATAGAEESIYFYDSDKPYFESAKDCYSRFSFHPLMLGCPLSPGLRASPTIPLNITGSSIQLRSTVRFLP
jgi:hypothetical protein